MTLWIWTAYLLIKVLFACPAFRNRQFLYNNVQTDEPLQPTIRITSVRCKKTKRLNCIYSSFCTIFFIYALLITTHFILETYYLNATAFYDCIENFTNDTWTSINISNSIISDSETDLLSLFLIIPSIAFMIMNVSMFIIDACK